MPELVHWLLRSGDTACEVALKRTIQFPKSTKVANQITCQHCKDALGRRLR